MYFLKLRCIWVVSSFVLFYVYLTLMQCCCLTIKIKSSYSIRRSDGDGGGGGGVDGEATFFRMGVIGFQN